MHYTKIEAIEKAKEFIEEVNLLEKKYNLTLSSDTGDVYLNFKTKQVGKVWDTINLGWVGDGSGIKVTEVLKDDKYYKEKALSKLSEKERKALGLQL